jgi:energy-coupling factor transporter ATP-binding protein EcfA2
VYRDLRIENFRRFQRFTMEGLGRINLLVGPNNCGKTTVLEAIDLLAEHLDPAQLGMKSVLRGAVTQAQAGQAIEAARVELRHLFFGHVARAGSELVISGTAAESVQRLRVSISREPIPAPRGDRSSAKLDGMLWLCMQHSGIPDDAIEAIRLSASAEWSLADLAQRYNAVQDRFHVPFIPAASWPRSYISERLSSVALNPEEALVLEVLRVIEPRVEGIIAVPLPALPVLADRGGIFVKLKGQRERVPIGSLGEGMWRLLALALALVKARGSVLLVDEIDIGLHYSAQTDMWRMVKQAAEELDVQVFATTHSRDCIYALAQLARADVTVGSDLSIQRIEGEHAVAYTEREIVLAAERGIEVR